MASESKPGRARREAQPAAAKPAPAKRPARRGGFSMDSEQQARLLLIGVTALVVIVAVAFIGFGYYNSVVKPRNRTVLQADDVKVSYSDMKRRMKFEYFSSISFQQNPSALPEATYANLLNELTLVQRAREDLGITTTPEELDKKLRARIGAAEDADQPTFATRLKSALETSGLKEKEYRRLVEAELLMEKVREKFKAEAPATVPQAKIAVMVTDDRTKLEAAAARVKAGDDWATVAKEVSIEPDVQTKGGIKEFAPAGSFSVVYDDYAFSGAVGQVSDIIDDNGIFYIVRVDAREERPLEEVQTTPYVNRAYADWLENVQEQMLIVRDWDEGAQRDALLDVLEDAPQRQPAQNQQQVPIQQPTVAAQPPMNPADGQ